MKQCIAPGCTRTDIKAKGYCNLHWQRIRRNGSLEPKMLKNGPRKQYPQEYRSWEGMFQRCYVKTNPGYQNYGGRGIKDCDRWSEKPYGFQNFMDDMGPKPSYDRTPTGKKPVWTIDRIDPNGDYTPENCRWANWITQESNKHTIDGAAGVSKLENGWKVRHRTASANIYAVFETEEMALEAKEEWKKKYPA